MDQIIIYKKGVNLKEKMADVRFSYQRPYKISFVTTLDVLKNSLSENPECLLYFFSVQLNNEERIIIKNVRLSRPSIKICLCSDVSFAMDAWNLDVFHFTSMPVSSTAMIHAYRKFTRVEHAEEHDIHLKTNEGLVKIPLKEINYIRASGNYSLINVSEDKNYLQTKQLQHYESLTEKNENIIRVHRSLILNMKRIKRISDKKIIFYNESKGLDVSKSLEIKVKKILLGRS